MNGSSGGGDSHETNMRMFIKAVQDQFRLLNTRLDSMELSCSKPDRRRAVEVEEEEDSDYDELRSSRSKKWGSKRDGNLGSIKMTIPAFQEKNDPELYLEWERKVEHVFDCHDYSEEKKVKLTVVKFMDYASIWWDQLVVSRHRIGERPIHSW